MLNSIDVEDLIVECRFMSYATRAEEFQIDLIEKVNGTIDKVNSEKATAIEEKDERLANLLLAYSLILTGMSQTLQMWISLRNDNAASAWSCIVSAEMSFRLAGRVHDRATEIGSSELAGWALGLQDLLFPPQVFVSAGMTVFVSQCSICNIDYEECNHIAGNPYMGEIAVRNILDAKLNEVSIVETPASKHCRILAISDRGGQRDVMTWRPHPNNGKMAAVSPQSK